MTDRENSELHAMRESIDEIRDTLMGTDGRLGIVGKVAVMWNSYVWILCTASAFAGFFAKWLIDRLTN